MAAAIVELDSLSDAVGSAAEDDDLALVRRPAFAFRRVTRRSFVRRIHVRRQRGEFRGAGIDALEAGMHAEPRAQYTHVLFRSAGELREPRIGKAQRLESSQIMRVLGQAIRGDIAFDVKD